MLRTLASLVDFSHTQFTSLHRLSCRSSSRSFWIRSRPTHLASARVFGQNAPGMLIYAKHDIGKPSLLSQTKSTPSCCVCNRRTGSPCRVWGRIYQPFLQCTRGSVVLTFLLTTLLQQDLHVLGSTQSTLKLTKTVFKTFLRRIFSLS